MHEDRNWYPLASLYALINSFNRPICILPGKENITENKFLSNLRILKSIFFIISISGSIVTILAAIDHWSGFI